MAFIANHHAIFAVPAVLLCVSKAGGDRKVFYTFLYSQKAITSFEKAASINKFYTSVYNSLAITYRKMGDFGKALEVYNAGKKALIELAHDEALKDKEKCYQDKLTTDGRKIMEIQPYYIEKVHEILKGNEDYSVLCTNEARIYSEMRKYEEAEELLREAIEFLPDESDYKVPFEAIEQVQKLRNGHS